MSSKHPIPIEVLNQHLVALGKTGAGKSSVMRVLAEQLLDAGKRVCIIDIKGDWYGIKLSADGKEAGYPLVAFGDFKNPDATDIPITENHGIEIAKLVTGGNRPCLIGFRGWMPGRVHKFWIDFISTVYNTNQSPLSIIIDEVHNYTPKGKVLSPEVGNCIYWTNKVMTEGRGIGLRVIAGSQRPAKVHNDFLANCETLVAMRVILPADKKAFHEWMKEYSDDDARGTLVLNSVSSMKTGEAFVWSPEAGIFEQLKFPMFKTFDSFASPKEGKQRQLKGWATVNLAEVKAKLSKVIEETKENDPRELKKKIRELQTELNKKQKPTPQTSSIQIDQGVINKAVEQTRLLYESKISKAQKEIDIIRLALNKPVTNMLLAAKALGEVEFPNFSDKLRDLELFKAEARKELVLPLKQKPQSSSLPTPPPGFTYERHEVSMIQEFKLLSGTRRMLSAVCMFRDSGLTMQRIKVLANIQDPSTFSRYKTTLSKNGLWKEVQGKYFPTESGIALIGSELGETPQTTDEVVAVWNKNLIDGARRMLKVLIQYNGEFISQETLTSEAEIKDPSTYSRYKTTLVTTHLAVTNGRMIAANKETLFL